MADRAIWLESGEMMKIGKPEEVTTEFTVGFDLRTEDKVDIGQPLVRIENAKRYYYSYTRGVVKAVDDVSLTVGEKEIVGLVGVGTARPPYPMIAGYASRGARSRQGAMTG
jgi:methyl coenzyme M reductase system subunit A2